MKRGKPLARRKPLQRRSRIRLRSNTKAYARRERDIAHMLEARSLPCIVSTFKAMLAAGYKFIGLPLEVTVSHENASKCSGRVQADHVGPRGMGQKSNDKEVVPMCNHHHRLRTGVVGGRGMFDGWSTLTMRAWAEWAVEQTLRDLELRRGA